MHHVIGVDDGLPGGRLCCHADRSVPRATVYSTSHTTERGHQALSPCTAALTPASCRWRSRSRRRSSRRSSRACSRRRASSASVCSSALKNMTPPTPIQSRRGPMPAKSAPTPSSRTMAAAMPVIEGRAPPRLEWSIRRVLMTSRGVVMAPVTMPASPPSVAASVALSCCSVLSPPAPPPCACPCARLLQGMRMYAALSCSYTVNSIALKGTSRSSTGVRPAKRPRLPETLTIEFTAPTNVTLRCTTAADTVPDAVTTAVGVHAVCMCCLATSRGCRTTVDITLATAALVNCATLLSSLGSRSCRSRRSGS
mmetsp:Transcript_15146/g.62990  ORF Transcript_15146/g.62990 Transcript_15146/m.62990 type:complete len:311 (-) Transcript_15146:427-1359(-)